MDLLGIIQDRINTEKTNTVSLIKDLGSSHAPTLARQQTLHQAMTARRETAFDHVAEICPQGFISTPEIHGAEIKIARIQGLVMTGKASLDSFLDAVDEWEAILKNEIDTAYPE